MEALSDDKQAAGLRARLEELDGGGGQSPVMDNL